MRATLPRLPLARRPLYWVELIPLKWSTSAVSHRAMSRFCKPPGSLAPSTCGKGVRTNPGRSAREDFSRVRPRCSSGNWWSLPVLRRTLPVFSGPPSLDQPKLRKLARRQGIAPCRPVLETRPSARTSSTRKAGKDPPGNGAPSGSFTRDRMLGRHLLWDLSYRRENGCR